MCVFKYLVTQSDPQKEFSLSILIINFLCFMVITSNYILIHRRSKGSSSNSSTKRNAQARKLQAKITFIIFTDFLAWAPFTIVCFMHFGGIIDATEWYPFFSVVILPLNSMINPILYNSALFDFIFAPLMTIYDHSSSQINGFISSLRRNVQPVQRENVLSGVQTQDTCL